MANWQAIVTLTFESRNSTARKLGIYAFIIPITVLFLSPIGWLIFSSLQHESELTSISPGYFPTTITFDQYATIFFDPFARDFLLSIRNSIIIASSTTLVCLIGSTLAAYAFARLGFRGRRPLFLLILVAGMIPAVSVIIPLFIIMNALELLDTYVALILANSGVNIAYAVWLMHGYMESLPWEIEDAARADGCSRLQALFKVVLPICKPGLVAVTIWAFMWTWDEFLFGLVLTSSYDAKPITVAITEFSIKQVYQWGLISAGAVLGLVPPIIIAIMLEKFLVKGLTLGAVKG